MRNPGLPREMAPAARLLAKGFLASLVLMLAACGPSRPVLLSVATPTDAERETIKMIEARMTEIRGLKPLKKVEYGFTPRESLGRVMEEYTREGKYWSATWEEIRRERQPVYELLGFISPGDDLVELMVGVSISRLTAFYSDSWGTVFLVDGGQVLDTSAEVILAHEFVHALQDQHFGLGQLAERTRDDWDAALAHAALVEGDATVAMQRYALTFTNVAGLFEFARAQRDTGWAQGFPEALQQEFAFPYEAGVGFVQALLSDGGWAAVNNAYRQPPVTTEQVIHPEKYLAGETGREIILGHVAKPLNGRLWFRSTGGLGEFLLRTHLDTQLSTSEAAGAAAGWGGDRWSLYTDDEESKLLHLVVEWDTPEELDEFYVAYLKWLDVASDGTSEVLSEDMALWHGALHSGYVTRQDGRITILLSSDREALEMARSKLGLP